MSTKVLSWLPSYSGARLTRRTFLRGAATGGGAAVLIACGGGSSKLTVDEGATSRQPGSVWFAKNDWKLPDETKDAVRGGTYRSHSLRGLSGHLDPITQNPSIQGAEHTHELLMFRNRGPGIDPKSPAAAEPVGALAESWEFADGGATVTFTMRQGVKWHNVPPVNGRLMDMEDWKSTFERHMATGEHRAQLSGVLDKAEFPDARHMVWKFKFPYSAINDQVYADTFNYNQMPKELNAAPALAEQVSIGTGFKILDKFQPALTVEYRKNPEYWGGDPFIERWHQPEIPEYANRYAQFVSGNIIDFEPSAQDILLLNKDAPNTVIVATLAEDILAYHRMGNMTRNEKKPWDDPRVRVAIKRTIDRKAIAEFSGNKEQLESAGIPIETRASTHLAPDPSYWLNPELGEVGAASANYFYDLAEARKLVSAAGYSNLPIELPYFRFQQPGIDLELHQLVMDSIDRSGIFKLKVHYSQNDAEHRLYRNDGKFDGMLEERGGGKVSNVDEFIYRNYHSEGNLPRSEQAYPDPRIDALALAQRKEMDVPRRMQILGDMQKLLAEVFPSIPGSWLYTTFEFRWPWLHNAGYGQRGGGGGQEVKGGHLHWLDSSMPNRG